MSNVCETSRLFFRFLHCVFGMTKRFVIGELCGNGHTAQVAKKQSEPMTSQIFVIGELCGNGRA